MRVTMRVCAQPGCPELVEQAGRCPGCRREADQRRGSFRQRGYSAAGHDRRFRPAVLAAWPTCAICGTAPSVVADHHPLSRRELVAQGADPDDPAFGRGLCTPCDKRQTAQRQGGFHAR